MQIITLEITNDNALKVLLALQEKNFVNIIAKSNFNSLALPGKPLTIKQFKNWIESRENGPSMNFRDAKAKWAKEKSRIKTGK